MKTFVVGDVHGRCDQLQTLVEMIPRTEEDSLVFLGDLIDRGSDVPGCVEYVIGLKEKDPEQVICLRGNHEQMLMDFIDERTNVWVTPVTGGEQTYEQYTGRPLIIDSERDLQLVRQSIATSVPPKHLSFFRATPFFHEDDYALYVHAGLDQGKHPRDTQPHALIWIRDMDFYKNYRGKPCLFGHTPTAFLPLRGRLGRHGIYIRNSAIGIDTGYNEHSPLSCLSLPDFTLYQTYPDGHQETHRITTFIPQKIRAMQRQAGIR